MSDQYSSQPVSDTATHEEMMSALFGQLIMQQTNMAMMLLGKVAHPESGKVFKDLEAARLFIDQLEMLEKKTKGNLTKEESGLLKQSLMNLQLAFVQAVESSEPKPPTAAKDPAASTATNTTERAPDAAATTTEDDHRKKFSKKY